MMRRVLFTGILTVQFLTLSAAGAPISKTDDPYPCPDCTISPTLSEVVKLADDPYPCPDCTISPTLTQSTQLADDPYPCPDCTISPTLTQAN